MSKFSIDTWHLSTLGKFCSISKLKDGSVKLTPIYHKPNGLCMYLKQTSANSIKIVEVSDDGFEISSDSTVSAAANKLYNKYFG